MEIPSDMLNAETLASIAREFVLTEGTDYGHRDWTIEEKVAQVLRAIKSGTAKVDFDPETETCTIQVKDFAKPKRPLAIEEPFL